MANKYVRSTDGNDADDGTTWALADATLTGAAAADAAGDVIWVSQVHAESTATAITFNWAGTAAAPTRVICGNDAAEPPTALATTATVTTTTDIDHITIVNAGYAYIYGITFNAGEGIATTAHIIANAGPSVVVLENCNLNLATTGASSRIKPAEQQNGLTKLVNCGFQFSNTGQGFEFNTAAGVNSRTIISGGSILSDAAITTLIKATNIGLNLLIEGCDLSNGAAAMDIGTSTESNCLVLLRNCKMPASWSGSINSATPGPGSVWQLHNSDSADTNYRYEKKTQFGTITHETTIVRTGGASDGITALSHKMGSN